MTYSTGSNTWPDAFEPDGVTPLPGSKVGKYFGQRGVGGVGGVTIGDTGEYLMVFEFGVQEANDGSLAAKELTIPDGFAIGKVVYLEVEEAFATGTIDLFYNGSTVLSSPLNLTTQAMGSVPITEFQVDANTPVTVVPDSVTGTPAAYAKLALELVRV